MKESISHRKWEDVRNKAVHILNAKAAEPGIISSDEMSQLIHEIDVSRYDLELENKRLLMIAEQAEKERSEYRELFDFAPEGFITLTSEGRISNINFTAALMLGKDPSLLIDGDFDTFLSNGSKAVFHTFLSTLFHSGSRQTCEVTLHAKGKTRQIEISGVITELSGQCFISLHDISSSKKTEKKLRRSKEKAETADRMKSSFLSTLSHEFRSPLNSIIGFSGILLHEFAGTLNEEQKKQIGMIQSSGRHLLSLINDLLDLSKIEAGQLNTNSEEFDIREMIEDVVRLQWPLALSKNISLKSDISSGVGTITSDRQRLRQVMLNLLSNALKFTEQGSVKVRCYRENDVMKIEVSDTGIGIENENLEKIFDPFIQIENNLTRSHTGSGLGLSVSKKLIEMLNGAIEVKSEFGKGTTFTIILPA